MLTQVELKTARRTDLNSAERPALLKISPALMANFLTQRNDLNQRGRRASLHGFVVCKSTFIMGLSPVRVSI